MKPASPVSLLLFLQLASALPLPTKELVLFDCHHRSCFSLSNPNTPPTKLTEPHFPIHQLSTPSQILDEIYDNAARAPSPRTPPTKALSSNHPLSSAYLLSLSKQVSTSKPDSTIALPSKPTSALPNLRKEDAQRYWESQSGSAEGITVVEFSTPSQAIKLCGHGRDQYLKIQGAYLAREYSDLIVVGIVVLFLAVVVALEACERVGDLRQIIFGTRKRRGEIYLEDSDTLYIVKKPFYLQPAPPRSSSKSHNSRPSQKQDQYRDGDSDTEVEREEFSYDSDAYEKV